MRWKCGENEFGPSIGCGRECYEHELDYSAWPPVCAECAKKWVPYGSDNNGSRITVEELAELEAKRAADPKNIKRKERLEREDSGSRWEVYEVDTE
jgi:hypothetical protein